MSRARAVRWLVGSALAFGCLSTVSRGEEPLTVSGLFNPRSAWSGPKDVALVAEAGIIGRAGDGMIAIVERSGRIIPLTTGLDDPSGMASVGGFLYVADRTRVWRIDPLGEAVLFADRGSFPRPIASLQDLAPDGRGGLFVSDSGGTFGFVYRLDPTGRATLVLDGELSSPQVERPAGLLLDDAEHLFLADSAYGHLYQVGLLTGTPERIGSGFGPVAGIARGARGRLFLGDGREGRLFEIFSDLEPPRVVRGPWKSAGALATTPDGRTLLVPDPLSGTITWFPIP